MNNSKIKQTNSYEEKIDNFKIRIKPLKPINREKFSVKERFNTPFMSKKNNMISSNYSEMCTDNQEIISQENRNLKSNISTEDINNDHHDPKIHEINKINIQQQQQHDYEGRNFKLNFNNNLGNDFITGDDYEDHIIMKNKIIYKLDEVDRNLEEEK